MVNLIVGALVLTFELTASRVVAPYMGTTIYTWTSIIGVILAALAVGYMLGGYLADKRHKTEDVVILLIASALLIMFVNLLKDWGLSKIADIPIDLQWQALIASVLLFAGPTVCMGAISPYLVRLSLKSISTSGRQVAKINAAGTIGALAGTFLTGYVLFGFIGTRYILGFLAVVLCLTSYIMDRRFLLVQRLLLSGAILAFALIPGKAHASGTVVQDTDSKYSRLLIRDGYFHGRHIRVLQADSFLQSGIYLDGDKRLVFAYADAFASAAKFRPEAKSILVIGGGALSFPEYLANNYPDAHIDVVEIDDKLAEISQESFGFKPSKSIGFIAADGRQFLNRNHNRYDMIFIDAFNSLVPPFQLFTKEAVVHIRASLMPNGIVVANTISPTDPSEIGLISGIVSTYKDIFKNVEVFKADVDKRPAQKQNLMLLASNANLPKTLGNLVKPAYGQGDKSFGTKFNIKFDTVQPFTDDFAPVERLGGGNRR